MENDGFADVAVDYLNDLAHDPGGAPQSIMRVWELEMSKAKREKAKSGAYGPAESRQLLEESKALMESFIKKNPKLPEAWFARGSAYYLLGNYAKAESDIEQALRLRPDYQEAADVLAKTKLRLEEAKNSPPPQPAAAKPALPAPQPMQTAAITPPALVAPPKPPAPVRAVVPSATAQEHEERGRAFTQSRKYAEALAELTQAIQLKPNLATAYNARGFVYLLERDYAHAVTDFDNAIRLNPAYANAYQNRSVARKAMGDAAGAAADLKAAR